MPHLEEDVSESIMKHELFYKAIPKGGKKHSYGLTTDDSTQAVAEIYNMINWREWIDWGKKDIFNRRI